MIHYSFRRNLLQVNIVKHLLAQVTAVVTEISKRLLWYETLFHALRYQSPIRLCL